MIKDIVILQIQNKEGKAEICCFNPHNIVYWTNNNDTDGDINGFESILYTTIGNFKVVEDCNIITHDFLKATGNTRFL